MSAKTLKYFLVSKLGEKVQKCVGLMVGWEAKHSIESFVWLIVPMNQVSSRMKLEKMYRKIMDLLEQCLAQVLRFTL